MHDLVIYIKFYTEKKSESATLNILVKTWCNKKTAALSDSPTFVPTG